MKKPYSEYHYSKASRNYIKHGIGSHELCKNIPVMIQNFMETHRYTRDNAIAATYTMIIETGCLQGHGTHLFVKRNIFDWLVSRAKDVEISDEWVHQFFGTRIDGDMYKFDRVFVVHVEGGSSPAGILCPLFADESMSRSSMALVITINHGETIYSPVSIKNIRSEIDDAAILLSKFVIGLYLYNTACGDVIIDGVPEDLKHEPRYKGIRKQVRLDDEVFDHRSISPHFRNGHFRLLSSDHFTKKRGQIVFVRDCFVKGRAAHVDEKLDTVHASI